MPPTGDSLIWLRECAISGIRHFHLSLKRVYWALVKLVPCGAGRVPRLRRRVIGEG